MKLDRIALAFVVVGVLAWSALFLFTAAMAFWPGGFVLLIVFAIVAFFVGTVISQRLNNPEDDYYEKNVDK